MKALYITIASGVACFGLWLLVNSYGDAKYQEGFKSAIVAQVNTDNAALISQAQIMVNAFNQTQAGLISLNEVSENPPAGPNVSSAIEWVRSTRKPNGSSR